MGSPLWTVAEFLNNAAIVACFQLYLHRRLGTRRPEAWRLLLGGLMSLIALSVSQYTHLQDSIRMPLLAVCCMLYGAFVSGGTLSQRLFHAFIAFSLVGLSDVVAMALITFLPGVTFGMVLQPTPYRLAAMVAAKAVLVPMAFWNSRRMESESASGPHLIYVAFVPLTSMAMLTALIQYEAELNNHGSMGLTLLTLGLLAINIMLLGLHGRLAVRATELQEKQRMLEQSEIQNRNFQETLAANNNMRGFRHDLKNHLQVLNCLLGMNRLERAREYLQEIGDFVDRNDFNVNSGVPLVDAVLGSKIAMAKRLEIDIHHTVLLEEDLPIEALDLCSLLGNTLDNALEACQKIAEGGERRIELALLARGGKLELTVRNTAPSGCGSSLQSTKKEEGHGLGLSIVRKSVEKYNGEIHIGCDAGEFSVRICLSGDAKHQLPERKKRALRLQKESLERPAGKS